MAENRVTGEGEEQFGAGRGERGVQRGLRKLLGANECIYHFDFGDGS